MADFSKNKILDIQHSRKKNKLSKYFSDISKAERDNVKYIVIDMWDTYLDLAYIYFYNAKIAIDSFHVIKHLNQAIISIRIKIMKLYDKDTDTLQSNDMYYYMLKKFHYFFTRNFDDIYSGPILIGKINSKWDKHEIRKYLLSINTDLDYAYYLKERYREFNLTAEYETCDEEFDELINEFLDSHLEEFRDFGQLLLRWKPYIKNSFLRVNGRRLSNGPIEGINSRIKTIIKSANGFKNFRRFRNRTIYSINKNVPIKYKPIKINNIKK
jgi:transposase